MSPHLWKTHLFSICWCLWLKCSCGLKTQLCGTETNISSWPRCRRVASRKSRMKASGCSWIASRFCMNASMRFGVYNDFNGCIIIINNHNMIIWFYMILCSCIWLHTVITVLMLLCINWRIAKQSIDVYSIFLAGCSCIKSLHASDSCSSSTEVDWRVCQVSRFQRSAQSMV